MSGPDASSDDGLLADQIRHGIDPEDYTIPLDERLSPARPGARDPLNFPDFNGKNTVEGKPPAPQFDSANYGTLDYQLDMRAGVTQSIAVSGLGMVSSGHGYLYGYTLYVAGGLLATDAVAIVGKSGKVYALIPASSEAWYERDTGNGIAYNDLSFVIYDLITQRLSDKSTYIGGIVYVAPMEGSF